ncbi:MAG: sulfite exporter TauE/SafE family protein [Gammaproteobacteria bacterium]|nr:sulfite exporter TauE/SafE family protein [Gammaproteobacteria bacterium]
MTEFLYALAGLAVGAAVGATGVGGGSLMTPMLILFYGVAPAMAVGTDLLFASLSKTYATLLHGRNGTLDFRLVGWLSLGSVPAVLATLVFLHGYGDVKALSHLIKLVLAAAVVVTALFTLAQETVLRRLQHWLAARELPPHAQRAATVVTGALIGALVTISSVGAGVIGMMVLLLLYPRQTPIRLVGSDLAHAVLITAIAGLGHAGLGTVDWSMLWLLLAGGLPGVWIGSRLGFRMPARTLKRSIAGLLLFVGGSTLAKAAGLL